VTGLSKFSSSYYLKVFFCILNIGGPSKQRSQSVCVVALKLNSVALVRKRTIPTERSPHVGEVSANLEGVAWSAQRIPKALISIF
jgi:hypothetical protein